jgi:hypothetical protein
LASLFFDHPGAFSSLNIAAIDFFDHPGVFSNLNIAVIDFFDHPGAFSSLNIAVIDFFVTQALLGSLESAVVASIKLLAHAFHRAWKVPSLLLFHHTSTFKSLKGHRHSF